MFFLRLFGGCSIESEQGLVTGSVSQRRRLALVALMAASPTGGIGREKAAAYLWPEADSEEARRHLVDAVYGLRRVLGRESVLTSGDELRLNTTVVRADVAEFQRQLACNHLAEAIELYRGPFMDGFFVRQTPEFERWVEGERDRLARKYVQALERLAEEREAASDATAAAELWRRLAVHDPLNSRVTLRLMRALDAAGDRAGAIQQAHVHAELLRTEIGAEPDPDVVAYGQRLRDGREPRRGGSRSASEPAAADIAANAGGAPEQSSNEARASIPESTAQLLSSAPAREAPVRPLESARPGRRPTRWLWPLGGSAALITLVAALLVRDGSPEAAQSRRGPATNVGGIRSLAVLPLQNVGRDSTERYFADGITDALIAELALYKQLRVISPDAVRQYAGARKPAGEIARELDVELIVRGTVFRARDSVRITAQLIRASTGEHLSAGSYEGDLRDVLALQREAARAIAGGLHVALVPEAGTGIPPRQPVDPRAFDDYVQAKYHRRVVTEESIRRAITILERAVANSPDFAHAHGELALAYVDLYARFQSSNDGLAAKAFLAIQKALSLDPGQEEAHIARGRLMWTPAHGFPHARAIADFKRVVARNPSSDEAHSWLGTVLVHLGLMGEARDALDMAQASNPFENRSRLMTGQLLLYELKPAEALAFIRETPPGHNTPMRGPHLAWALLLLGRREEAAAALDEALRLAPDDRNGTVSGMHAVLAAAAGDGARARQWIRQAATKEERSIHFHHTAYSIGSAYSLLNRPDSAVMWLRRAAHEGFPCYPLFARDPALAGLRGDRRFVALLADLEKQFAEHRAALGRSAAASPRP